MRIKILIAAIAILILAPMAARAIDQATIDRMVFLLQQPEWNGWGDAVFDDLTLYDGLLAIYANAVNNGDGPLLRKVIWAMGETHMAAFAPTVIGVLPDEPVAACMALGKIPSEDSVDALIDSLSDDDPQVRDAAAWGLGNLPYDSNLAPVRDQAISALDAQKQEETESWVRERISGAVDMIQTGISTSAAFQRGMSE